MSRATHRLVVDDCLNSGELLVCIKDTDKAIQIKLLENTLRFSPGHLDMMFGKSNRVSIPTSGKSPHKLFEGCDGAITIYPYRAGVPYLFEKITEGGSAMTDREKLVGLVTEICNKVVKACGCSDMLPTYSFNKRAVYDSIADYLIANGVTVREWISVEDRLPESEDVVLIAYKGRNYVGTGYFYEGFCEWDSPAGQKIVPPDYWMPLPEAPKESEK